MSSRETRPSSSPSSVKRKSRRTAEPSQNEWNSRHLVSPHHPVHAYDDPKMKTRA